MRSSHRLSWALLLGILGLVSTSGCQNTPLNSRSHFSAVPQADELKLTEEAWREILAREKASPSGDHQRLVKNVGRKLADVSDRPGDAWEFHLTTNEEPYAFCLPGGKVAISEGMLSICRNEAGLAVVMAHEMAHALARHGNERMSQLNTLGIGGRLSQEAADRQLRWQQAQGVTTRHATSLPYSRQHRSEADSIGVMLMAKAGYDPAEAPSFWQRMSEARDKKPNRYLATRPYDASRATGLQQLLPQARAIYDAAPNRVGQGVALAGLPNIKGEQLASNFPSIDLASLQSPTQPAAMPSSTEPASTAAAEFPPAMEFQVAASEGYVPPIQRPRAEASLPQVEASSDDTARPFPTTP